MHDVGSNVQSVIILKLDSLHTHGANPYQYQTINQMCWIRPRGKVRICITAASSDGPLANGISHFYKKSKGEWKSKVPKYFRIPFVHNLENDLGTQI